MNHKELKPIWQSTVNKIEKKFRETGHVRDLHEGSRYKTNVLLVFEENPHTNLRQAA